MLVQPSRLQQLSVSDGENSFCDLYFSNKDSSDTDYGWCGTGRRHRPHPYDHIQKKNNKDFTLWLKTRHLLSTLNTDNTTESEAIIICCLQQISQSVMHGLKDLLNIVIDEYKNDPSELTQIHSIICNEISKNQKTIMKPYNKSLFDLLSTVSISKICTYLKRSDITSFKRVAYDIGLVCLRHMNKYRFGICNTNKLIQFPLFYKNIHYLDYNKLVNYDMYNGLTVMRSLQLQFETMYSIPLKYQFLVRKRIIPKTNNSDSNKQIQCIRDVSIKKRRFFLFDTRNVIVINKNSEIRIMSANDKNNNDEYKLELLQYFDIKKQVLYTVQTLLIHKSITPQTVIKYIKKHFISTCNQQRKWYKKFKKYNAKDKLMLFKHTRIAIMPLDSNQTILNRPNDGNIQIGILIFQINIASNHKKKKHICRLQSNYKKNGKYFCENIYDFYEKLTSTFHIKLQCFHDCKILKSHLRYLCARNSFNPEHFDIDKITKRITDISFEQNSFTTYSDVRIKISKLMNGVIKPCHIQLSHKNRILPFNQPCACGNEEILFEFVSYNTQNIRFQKNTEFNHLHRSVSAEMKGRQIRKRKPKTKLYQINIFQHSQYVIPIIDTSAEIKKIRMRYSHKIKVNKTFISSVMHEISQPKYGNSFEGILALHKENIGCDTNGNILYALHFNSDTSDMHRKMHFMNGNEYIKCGDSYDELSIDEINLILYRNPQKICKDLSTKSVPILVRVWLRKLLFDHFGEDICGIPLKLYMKCGETMQDLVERLSLLCQSNVEIRVYKERSNYDRFLGHISELSIKEFENINVKCYEPNMNDLFILEIQFDAYTMYQSLCAIREQIKLMM